MNKLRHIVGAVALITIVIGVFAIGVGFFMGSSPVAIRNHGSLTEYVQRLELNRDIILRTVTGLLNSWGIYL